jgi:hypothetical protein
MKSEIILYHPSMYPGLESAGIRIVRHYSGFLTWYQTAVVVASLLVIFTNMPIYAYLKIPALLPKFLFFGLFLLLMPLLFIKSRAFSVYVVSPFALWALLLIILNLVHVASLSMDADITVPAQDYKQMEVRIGLVMTRIQYVAFAWFLGFAVMSSNRQTYQKIFGLLAVALPCLVMLDFVRPGLLYPLDASGAVLGRAGAMFINPTMAAEALVLVFLFSCAVTSTTYRLPLLILLGIGVLMTFTRSAIIAWALLWILLIAGRVMPKSSLIAMSIMIGAGLMFMGLFENYLSSRQDFVGAVANLQARLLFFSNVTLGDDSAMERAEVLRGGWDLFMQHPIFGAGAGATQFWSHRGSTHNQLLLMAAEYGVFGIALWIWMVIILLRGEFFQNRSLQVAMVFLFVFMSMFTHQMLDSASYWLATFALVSMKKRRMTLYVSWPQHENNRSHELA